ncbi:MAG TPA: DUF2127 domain-containing protein [Planctomycetaceae bacterium]|nr:DUF2127 domain-containing protein [Planctomycetaceae bacterium]
MTSNPTLTRSVRAVALVEAAKASLVLLAGFGILALLHHDVHALATDLIERLHLNPARKVPRIFIDAASRLTDARLWLLATLALVYATVRATEAYGLWFERPWAEWFALVTGAIYLPVEIYELWEKVTWIRVCALAVNAGIVAAMAYALWRSRSRTA